jgi:hypothetical protein
MRALLAIAITLATAAPAAADDVPPVRTHTTTLTPTGELLRRGQLQRSYNIALQWDAAFGLADRVELRLQAELLVAADLQLRADVMPRSSPFRLVLGGSAAGTFVNGGKGWLGGSVTAAYRGDSWQAHATARVWDRIGPGVDLGLATAGLMGRFGAGDRHLLFVDVGQIAWREVIACPSARAVEPTPAPSCDEAGSAFGVAFGAWWGLRGISIGLSAIVVRSGDTLLPIGPLLSMSWGD